MNYANVQIYVRNLECAKDPKIRAEFNEDDYMAMCKNQIYNSIVSGDGKNNAGALEVGKTVVAGMVVVAAGVIAVLI